MSPWPTLRTVPLRELLLLLALAILAAPTASATEPVWHKVDVTKARTSIYVGSVTLTMPVFERHGAQFKTTYAARVFPFAFYNEEGSLEVTVSDEQLRELGEGRTIEFSGRAVTTKGSDRRIEARATPEGPHHGRLKVRVWVKGIELIFNTRYRAVGASPGESESESEGESANR